MAAKKSEPKPVYKSATSPDPKSLTKMREKQTPIEDQFYMSGMTALSYQTVAEKPGTAQQGGY